MHLTGNQVKDLPPRSARIASANLRWPTQIISSSLVLKALNKLSDSLCYFAGSPEAATSHFRLAMKLERYEVLQDRN